MKPSKKVSDLSWRYDVKVVLPRIKLTLSKSQPESCFKRKKPRRGRSSAWSDKENDNLANVVHSKPNLSLIQKEKSLNSNQRDGHLDLSAADLKLVDDVLNKRETRTTEYLRVALHRIDSSKTFNGNVHYSKSTGTRSKNSNVEVGISSSKHQKKKTKKEKCYRKDSGIGIESPKAKTRTKRKLSSHLDYQSDDAQENTTIMDSSENEVADLADIIQLYSSHTCSNKVDHKINNVETVRTSKGLYVHRDFEIRMTQLCTDQPSKNSTSACSASVVASTTRCENIEKSAIKECRNVAVEKRIGINTRVTVGDRVKNCTRIVESKLVETTEQRHKRIKLDEPSGMVTRRKAAINLEYKFYTLTNKKDCSVIESSNIANKRSDQLKQMQKNGINQKKKSMPSKKVFPIEKKPDISNEKSKDDRKSLRSKSFQSSGEGKKKKAETFKNIATNPEAKNGFNKILKDVTLHRVENTELWTGHIQKFEHSIEKKTLQERRERSKKINDINQTTNNFVHEAEVIAGTNQLRNSTKTKKLLNNEENSSSSKVKRITRANSSKESNNSSAADTIPEVLLSKEKKLDLESSARLKGRKCNQQVKNNELQLPKERLNSSNDSSAVEVISPRPGCSGVSLPKGKKHHLKPSAKIKDHESKQQMTDDEVKLPKKSSNLPAKKLMKKSEALEKTERYNKKKKVLINGHTTILSSTISVLLEDIALPRRVTRFSSKTQSTSLVASASKLETARGTPCVTFSSKTPKTIPRKDNENNWDLSSTPCILLDRLDANDISTYAITPLREDRLPLAPKSTEDYGIDDVNTDDSTDEEENPKKRVPNWVNSVGYNSKVQFYFPRDVILSWIRPPKKKFTIQNLFT